MRKLTTRPAPTTSPASPVGFESEEYQGQVNVELNNGDFLNSEVTSAFEAHRRALRSGARTVRAAGSSTASPRARLSYHMGLQRRISGGITLGYGSFYDGTLTEATWRGRVEFTPQFYAEPTLSWNRVEAPYGRRQRQPREHAAHLHGDAADVRRGARPVPRRSPPRCRRTSASGGSISRAVSCSWSTATAAPRPAAGYPTMQSRSFVVKLTKLFRW